MFENMYEIKAISTIKNRKYEDFKKYGWRVKIKDTRLHRTFAFNLFINRKDHDFVFFFAHPTLDPIGKLHTIDLYDEEVIGKIRDYLIENNEVYMGEDGDYYLVGEDE